MKKVKTLDRSLYKGLAIVGLTGLAVQAWVNREVPIAFIDEYYHLRMTEQYLVDLDFLHYDSKITTPPGLYILGFIFGVLIQIPHLLFTGTFIKYEGPIVGEERAAKGKYAPSPGMLYIRYLNSVALPLVCFVLLYKIFSFKKSKNALG